MDNVKLAERAKNYGPFVQHAETLGTIWNALMNAYNAKALDAVHREGLRMIEHKVCRIVTGDPDYADSWDDIAGYAKRVADYVRSKKTTQTTAISSDKAYVMPLETARPDLVNPVPTGTVPLDTPF